MGLLGEALRQLEVRPTAILGPAPSDDSVPASGEQPAAVSPDAESTFEPLAVDYSDDLEADVFAQAAVQRPDAAALAGSQFPSSDKSIEQILDFAESAIQAASSGSCDLAISGPPPVYDPAGSNSATIEPLVADIVPNGRVTQDDAANPAVADRQSSISIDRAYGRLWDNLSAALDSRPPWTIVAVSPDRSANATWILPAAVAFGQRYTGRILLIDASRNCGDNGSLAELFGLIPEYGLTDVIRRVVEPREAVQKTSVPGIELMSIGTVGSNSVSPANRYAEVLSELKSEYQLTLIRADDPEDAQVRPVFSAADGTLLVIELGRTERASTETASNSLYLAGARLLGCIARN